MVSKSRSFGTDSGRVTRFESGYEFPYALVVRGLGHEEVEGTNSNYGGNNSLFLYRRRVNGSTTTGKFGDRFGYDDHVDVPTGFSSAVQAPSTPDVDVSKYINPLFAASNPYRANILVPAFLAELRDLPKMIYDLGRLKLNRKPIFHSPADLAKAWVGANFGWAPLIGDLVKLADFHLKTEKREKEFDRLYSSAGLVRRVQLGNDVISPPGKEFYWGQQSGSWPMLATGTGSTKVWGVVRYRPAQSPSGSPTRRPAPVELRRILAGLSRDGVTASAWELIPWSWLIDYVYDIGGALKANSGQRFLTIERACIMVQTNVQYTHVADIKIDAYGRRLILTPGKLDFEWKQRTPVSGPSIFPTPHVAELSAAQLSILGSLTFLRVKNLR